MTHILLILVLALPAFAARKPSADLDEERAALRLLQTKFSRLRATVDETDTQFAKMRLAINGRRYKDAENLAPEISKLITTGRRQWREVENYYSNAESIGMNFSRQLMAQKLGIEDDLITYLRFRRHNRFGSGMPMEMQMAAWRGLRFGEKAEEVPTSLRRTIDLGGLPLKADYAILLVMTNGGIIRGKLIGVTRESELFVREVMPNTLSRYQLDNGWYRAINFADVARMEVIRPPRGVAPQDNPTPVISPEGEYNPFFARPEHVTRIKFRTDDLELLEMVKEGRSAEAKFEPKIEVVDTERDTHPSFAPIFFLECEILLRK